MIISVGYGDTTLPATTDIISTSTATSIPPTQYPTAECIDEDILSWKSFNNQIYLNGIRFNVKGLSWFGFETDNNNLYGLDVHDIDWYLNWMLDNGFNAIRLPFSEDFINDGAANQNAYKSVVEAAGLKGLLVMPQLRSTTADSWIDALDLNSNSEIISAWQTMADLLKDEYNVFIADIYNEPDGVDNESEWVDWIQFNENIADMIWSKGVNWMVAVQGTGCNSTTCALGENLEDVKLSGITFDLQDDGANRFVWSPHVYGGDVTGNYNYSNTEWQSLWGYLVDGSYQINRAATVIAEFGTNYKGEMVNWLNDLIKYLKSIDQRNTFWWALNPNAPNVGGLLHSDWTTPETEKLNALHHLQQDPSRVIYDDAAGRVCIYFGGPVTTGAPTMEPTFSPTMEPTAETVNPTKTPTDAPTEDTSSPTLTPTQDTATPTATPTPAPTIVPTAAPTDLPSISPSDAPTEQTSSPTTSEPTTAEPTVSPTTSEPTVTPTAKTSVPSISPTPSPSISPTAQTSVPSSDPTMEPTTTKPTGTPTTETPTTTPTTSKPTNYPSNAPTQEPTTSTTNDGYIHIRNAPDMQQYYLSFFIDNIEDCMDEIENVQLLENGEWRTQTQYYYQPGTENGHMGGYKFSFHHNGYKFDDLLPISLRILKTNGEYISLQGIMTDIIPDHVFGTDKTCDSVGIDDDDNIDLGDNNIVIKTCGGSGSWWYSAQIINLNPNIQITEIKMRDASGNNDWMTATGYIQGNKCYFWSDGNKPYQLPIDFKITANDETIEGYDIVTAFNGDGSHGDMAQNFQHQNINGLNSNDTNGDDKGLTEIEIFVIIICIIAALSIIVGIIYWKRRKKRDIEMYNKKDSDSVAMVPTNCGDTPITYDEEEMSTNQQTNILAADDDEEDV